MSQTTEEQAQEICAGGRDAVPGPPLPPFRPGPIKRLWARWSEVLDHRYGWQSLPPLFGALTLAGLRTVLRGHNLQDTNRLPATDVPRPPDRDPRWLRFRSPDGTYNDLERPTMGAAGSRFGRNVPVEKTVVDRERLLLPNPRQVSRELLTREQFIPAGSLNLLAAAWLQFMVHDWLQHGRNERSDPYEIPLAEDDPWPQRPMSIHRTRHDPTRPRGATGPPSFQNVVSHWWDGSQIYGSDLETQRKVRAGVDGKLALDSAGLLPRDPRNDQDVTGVTQNYWLGLSLMHTLFTLEHNAICDALRAEHASWSDDDLFDHARLVNVALMAKIHTVEWTPAILSHPTLQIAMNANWWGLAGRWIREHVGRIAPNETLSGIPGSATDQFGVPYSITEDFIAVYRMHPLIPDDFDLRSHRDDASVLQCGFRDLSMRHTRRAMEKVGLEDTIYSFGTSNPGAICLHNFPRFLQTLELWNGRLVDLAATDILRNRERGVPRYNEFLRLLHKKPPSSFEELTGNPEWAREIERVYAGDLEAVDLMIGLYAENPPKGFGFSDTAFRIFILMASRRLNSDRFFTTDFRPEVYTEAGLRWVQDNGLGDVVRRHFPDLGGPLSTAANPFAPWPRPSAAG